MNNCTPGGIFNNLYNLAPAVSMSTLTTSCAHVMILGRRTINIVFQAYRVRIALNILYNSIYMKQILFIYIVLQCVSWRSLFRIQVDYTIYELTFHHGCPPQSSLLDNVTNTYLKRCVWSIRSSMIIIINIWYRLQIFIAVYFYFQIIYWMF